VAASDPDSPPPTPESAGAPASGRRVGTGSELALDREGGDGAGEDRLTSPVESPMGSGLRVRGHTSHHVAATASLLGWVCAPDAGARARLVGMVGVRVGSQCPGRGVPHAAGDSAARVATRVHRWADDPKRPRAQATLFATAYAAVRIMHLALYADASRATATRHATSTVQTVTGRARRS